MALGEEKNTYKINEPGKYYDPVSKKSLVVTMHAGADALARMGWERVGDVTEEDIKDPYNLKETPVETPKVKDAKEGVK